MSLPQPQVTALPPGASTRNEAAAITFKNNQETQAANNNAMAKGGKKRGGGIEGTKVIAPYPENSAGGQGVQSQTTTAQSNFLKNQENTSMDSAAFKKGGKRRIKSRKIGKRKTKRHRTRKHRKYRK